MHAVADQYKEYYNVQNENVFHISPNEDTCPGITLIKKDLMSWEWCFGHTPRFTVTKSFPMCLPSPEYDKEKLPS
ncbi:Lipoyltransferase 1, mitochondrial, partial [Stegodyphus mimosarum]